MKRGLFASCLLCMMLNVCGLTGMTRAEDATPTPTPGAAEAVQPAEEEMKLNVNFASKEELLTLPGIDDALTAAIMTTRPFAALDDLRKVEGMTQQTFDDMLEFIEITPLNINAATVAQLQILPDVDEQMARAIIDGRPYKIVEELLKIKGFGEARLNAMRSLIDAAPVDPNAATRGWDVKQRRQPRGMRHTEGNENSGQ